MEHFRSPYKASQKSSILDWFALTEKIDSQNKIYCDDKICDYCDGRYDYTRADPRIAFCDCDVPVGKYGYCTNKNVPTGMIHHVLRVLEWQFRMEKILTILVCLIKLKP